MKLVANYICLCSLKKCFTIQPRGNEATTFDAFTVYLHRVGGLVYYLCQWFEY